MDTEQLRICFMDVLKNLNENKANQFGDLFGGIVYRAALHKFIPAQERGKESLEPDDQNKVRELFWSFIIQGILMPGFNSSNPNLPFFALTDYGRQVLSSPDPIPHDPDGYLKHLANIAPNLDPVAKAYVREGLDCFLHGNYTASVVMLGVGSEKLIFDLAQAFQKTLHGDEATKMQKSIDKDKVSDMYEEFKKRLKPRIQQLPPNLSDGLEAIMDGPFNIIRTHRNAAGHPTGQIFDRVTALGLFSSFPFYCKRISELIDYWKNPSKQVP